MAQRIAFATLLVLLEELRGSTLAVIIASVQLLVVAYMLVVRPFQATKINIMES